MEFFSSIATVDNQSVTLIGFSVLLSFLLSSLVVFTYDKVSRDIIPPDHFLQSLILMSIVTTMIMQSIGDSPARGFGIFGALAILRFRTQIISPHNIAFIFAAMAVGIACGVYSFINAIIGTLAFCLIAFFLRLTPFSQKNSLKGQLRLELNEEEVSRITVEKVVATYAKRQVLKRYRIIPDKGEGIMIEYTYDLRLHDTTKGAALARALESETTAKAIRLNFDDTYISMYA